MGGEKQEALLKWLIHMLEFCIILMVLGWGLHWINVNFYFHKAWEAISHLRLTSNK